MEQNWLELYNFNFAEVEVFLLKKGFFGLFFLSFCYAEIDYDSAQTLSSILQSQYNIYKIQSTSLFSRIGTLRNQENNNTLWVNESFGFLRSQSRQDTLKGRESYNDFILGFDSAFDVIGGKVFLGGSFNAIVANEQTRLYQNDQESYASSVYLSYLGESRLFFDVYAKYFYNAGKFTFQNSAIAQKIQSLHSHNFLLGADVGQRFALMFSISPSYVFWEPSLQIFTGYLPREVFYLPNGVSGRMAHQIPFALDLRLAIGKEFNSLYRGDIKGGIAFGYDNRIGGDIALSDGSNSQGVRARSDMRMSIFLESDFIYNKNFRFFFRSESSFFGRLDVIYKASLGIRFSFGKVLQQSLKKSNDLNWQDESLQ